MGFGWGIIRTTWMVPGERFRHLSILDVEWGHIKNIHLHSCKHKTVTLKLTLTLTDTGGAVLSPDPNANIQKTENLQIKTENTKLRLRKI